MRRLVLILAIAVAGCGSGVGDVSSTDEGIVADGETGGNVGSPQPTVRDEDDDGVADTEDLCPATPSGQSVDLVGCAASQIDSDQDGFTDEEEVTGIPGTDPFDPFDNPLNVRDSDADGCSDFDELFFDGFCDNDPNTRPNADFDVLGARIVADDGQFLGIVSTNSFDPDSIANSFGTYGNPFSSLSIWNKFGTYGSDFNSLSPWSSFSSRPPVIVNNAGFVAYLTNGFLSPRITPNELAILVGRPEETR